MFRNRYVFPIPYAAVMLSGALGSTVGCASTSGTMPDDMSAAQHRRAADAADEEASAHDGAHDPSATAERKGLASRDSSGLPVYDIEVYNPTAAHLEHAAKLHDQAEQHRDAAKALEAFEQSECAQFPPQTRKACPLLGAVLSVTELPSTATGGPARTPPTGGVRLTFGDGTNLDAVIAHMRCHVAYALTQGNEGMGQCPLYIVGVKLEAINDVQSHTGVHGIKGHGSASGTGTPDGRGLGVSRASSGPRVERGPLPNTVDLIVDDLKLAQELARRAKTHLVR